MWDTWPAPLALVSWGHPRGRDFNYTAAPSPTLRPEAPRSPGVRPCRAALPPPPTPLGSFLPPRLRVEPPPPSGPRVLHKPHSISVSVFTRGAPRPRRVPLFSQGPQTRAPPQLSPFHLQRPCFPIRSHPEVLGDMSLG